MNTHLWIRRHPVTVAMVAAAVVSVAIALLAPPPMSHREALEDLVSLGPPPGSGQEGEQWWRQRVEELVELDLRDRQR